MVDLSYSLLRIIIKIVLTFYNFPNYSIFDGIENRTTDLMIGRLARILFAQTALALESRI